MLQCVKDVVHMEKGKVVYKSYLLRLWCYEENGRIHIRLQTIEKEPVIFYFVDMDSFVAFWLHDLWAEPMETNSCDE
jgi:hypothetical protein